MLFEANKKSIGIAYLLWFCFGVVGGHRFYVGKTGSAVTMLLLTLAGFALLLVGVGIVIISAVGLWVLVDAFLIPGWIRNQNNLLAVKLGA